MPGERKSIRDILSKYGYTGDVASELDEALSNIESYKGRVEAFLRRRSTPFIERERLIEVFREYNRRVKEVTGSIFTEGRRVSQMELRAAARKLADIVNEMLERVDEVVGS